MLVTLALALQLAGASLPPAATQAGAPSLTLADAVALARRASPMRRSAVALAEGTVEAWRRSGRPLNPAIDVHTENWVPGSTPGLIAPLLDVFAVAVQPIELGGKRAGRRNVAAADRDVAAAGLQFVDREITLETVRLYVQALRARGQLEALASNRDGLGALIETMRRRVQEGLAAESDRLKFLTEAARVDADTARTRLELSRSLAALTSLLGAPAALDAAQLVTPAPIEAPSADASGVVAAVARLPEVALARTRVERAGYVRALERARRIPDPAVTAGYKRTAGQDTTVVGVSVVVPIFERNAQAVALAVGEERAAAFDLDALSRRLTAEVISLLQAATALAARAERADADLLAPADGVRSAARAAFREGSADMLRLIDAERVFADVRRAALDLKLDAYLAAVEARFALGQEDIP